MRPYLIAIGAVVALLLVVWVISAACNPEKPSDPQRTTEETTSTPLPAPERTEPTTPISPAPVAPAPEEPTYPDIEYGGELPDTGGDPHISPLVFERG